MTNPWPDWHQCNVRCDGDVHAVLMGAPVEVDDLGFVDYATFDGGICRDLVLHLDDVQVIPLTGEIAPEAPPDFRGRPQAVVTVRVVP